VIIELRFSPDQRRQINDLPAGPSFGERQDLDAYRADGHGEPRVGLQPNPGRVEEPRSPRRKKHGRQGAEGAWDPAGARAALVVAHVSARPLGCDRWRRLLHDGSMDAPRAGGLLHVVRAGSQEPAGEGGGLDAESRFGLHGPGGAAPHRRSRQVSGGSSSTDLRSGRQVDKGISRPPRRGGGACGPDAAPRRRMPTLTRNGSCGRFERSVWTGSSCSGNDA
jgi:hypothetical protein